MDTAAAFLEGRTLQPLDRVVRAMQEAADAGRFELATRWRERFEQLEWLVAATSRARTARDLLTFVYRDPGDYGDDRVYLVRQGVVRASFPFPATPIEREAFCAVVATEAAPTGHAERSTAARFDRRNSAVDRVVPSAPRSAPANDALRRVDQPVGV